jgi:hypothetical protein
MVFADPRRRGPHRDPSFESTQAACLRTPFVPCWFIFDHHPGRFVRALDDLSGRSDHGSPGLSARETMRQIAKTTLAGISTLEIGSSKPENVIGLMNQSERVATVGQVGCGGEKPR